MMIIHRHRPPSLSVIMTLLMVVSTMDLIGPVRGNVFNTTNNNNSTNGTAELITTFPTNRGVYEVFADPTSNIKQLSKSKPNPNYIVGAYYYPWHTNNFHNSDPYLRKFLAPKMIPWIGEYDDSRRETITAHLRASRQANINLWVTSWFGPTSREDRTTRLNILVHPEFLQQKQLFCIHYETINRMRNKTTNAFHTNNVVGDITHLCNNYFKHPNYFRHTGRPVLVLYLSRLIDDENVGGIPERHGFLKLTLQMMRDTAKAVCGETLWIVGDQIYNQYNPNRDDGAIKLLDAITDYDVYGHMDNESPTPNNYGFEELQNQYTTEKVGGNGIIGWRQAAESNKKGYIPGVTTGFNRRAMAIDYKNDGSERKALSRRLTPSSPEGTLFAKSLEYARDLVHDRALNMIFVTSFNEFNEDTQMEPVVVDPMVVQLAKERSATLAELDALKTTTVGLPIYEVGSGPPPRRRNATEYIGMNPTTYITQGLKYEAYEDLYLNILRRSTILPFFDETFEFSALDSRLSLLQGQVVNNPKKGGVGGFKSLKLPRTSTAPSSTMRIKLNDATFYNYLTIEFQFLSSGAFNGDKLHVACKEESNNLVVDNPIGGHSWTHGTDFFNNNFYYYAVTECNIMNVSDANGVVIDFQYTGPTTTSSMFVDDIKVFGVTASPGATRAPTQPPTRAPSQVPTRPSSPTRAPTRSPTRVPTRVPTALPTTRAPTKSPTKAPTQVPTRPPSPTMAPTRVPTALPTTRAPTKSPTRAPTQVPTRPPSPTRAPTRSPTKAPTRVPTALPTTRAPTQSPTKR